jgi:CRISPR/Cas system-associated exonuclease Cas4 (RecB family)
VEEPVELPLGDSIVVTGRIDLACQSGDRLEIVDFKVRSRRGLEILRPDLQARTYALACEEARRGEVDCVVIHLLAEGPGTDEDKHPWNTDLREATRRRLVEAVDGIRDGRFDASPGPHCSLCEFRNLCPHSETRREPHTTWSRNTS